jgi:hypothetical protein
MLKASFLAGIRTLTPTDCMRASDPASLGEGLKSFRFFTIMANGKPANASTKPETISIVISKT